MYCVEIWGSSLKLYLDPPVKIQKKCIRTISFSEYVAPSELLFQKQNVLNKIQRILSMMFKRSIAVLLSLVSALLNIILLFIHITLEEVNLSTLL